MLLLKDVMKHIVVLICLLLSFYSFNALSLEITLKIPIYHPLSKAFSNSLPGSSKIIIDKSDLSNQENAPIHSILDQASGIKNRSIYGSNSSGSKSTLDIRGMGAQAKSNVLILVNGQRLNNIDMSEIDFPSIPKQSIDKIEVYKGNAASVLYGDGAIGGAINIITNPEISEKNSNELIFRGGTYNKKDFIFNSKNKIEKFTFNTYFNHSETDGYRDENEQQQNNFTSELRFPGNKGDHFFAINYSEQIMSTPSDRSQSQLFEDRRGSDTPDDFINSEGSSLFYGRDYKINDNSTYLLNSSLRLKNSYSDLQSTSYPSYNNTFLTNYQFNPRINHLHYFFGKSTNSIYGIDIQYADYDSSRKKNKEAIPLHVYDAWQATQSLYLQQTINLSNNTSLGTGIRIQRNKINIEDKLDISAPDYAGWQTEHEKYSDYENNSSFNIGIDHQLDKKLLIFGRIGSGFRYPNIDDRIGGSGGTSLHLNTQKTQDIEIGSSFKGDNFLSNFSIYVIEGKNELTYDTDAFENINIDSTRRFGFELALINRLSNKINLKNNFTFSKAKYTSGNIGAYATDFKDKDIPLVPQYSLDTSLEYKFSQSLKLVSTIKYQDDMRMESDDENFQDTKIPNYVLGNINLSYNVDKFYSIISINNILNHQYHNYAVASSSTNGSYNAYPEPGREINFTVGIKF